MGDTMKPTEREELIQRYYDGETVGRESELAERMLQEDPVAQEILEGLVRLSGSIQLELDSAVEAEDFSGYWQQIEERLPDGPLSEEVATLAVPAAADVVVGRPQRMGRPRRSWLPWLLGPSLGAAAAAMLMVLLQPAELRVEEQRGVVRSRQLYFHFRLAAGPMAAFAEAWQHRCPQQAGHFHR